MEKPRAFARTKAEQHLFEHQRLGSRNQNAGECPTQFLSYHTVYAKTLKWFIFMNLPVVLLYLGFESQTFELGYR
ncbi:hypothetical protein MH216_22310, partial [Paenibacillus larvae]|uniref:hypothetical protein n=1 Tax=Paenibacillus larvae TaxID=1464 RepID=UPI0022815BD3